MDACSAPVIVSMTNDKFAKMFASPPNVTPADLIAMRVRIGLTQEKLAARIGVTTRTIQHWEAGTRKPPTSAVIVLTLMSANP